MLALLHSFTDRNVAISQLVFRAGFTRLWHKFFQLNDDQRQYEAALNDRDATLRRMREECQTLVAELQALLDTKQLLDAEIAIYRKMLEGEESR